MPRSARLGHAATQPPRTASLRPRVLIGAQRSSIQRRFVHLQSHVPDSSHRRLELRILHDARPLCLRQLSRRRPLRRLLLQLRRGVVLLLAFRGSLRRQPVEALGDQRERQAAGDERLQLDLAVLLCVAVAEQAVPAGGSVEAACM